MKYDTALQGGWTLYRAQVWQTLAHTVKHKQEDSQALFRKTQKQTRQVESYAKHIMAETHQGC